MTQILTVFFAWLVAYAVVTGTLLGFQWAGVNLVLPVQTLLLTAAFVPAMIFKIGPLAARLAQKLTRRTDEDEHTTDVVKKGARSDLRAPF